MGYHKCDKGTSDENVQVDFDIVEDWTIVFDMK